MSVDPVFLASVMLFFAVLLFIEGAYYLIHDWRSGGRRKSVNRRLRLLSSGVDSDSVLARLRRRPAEESGLLGMMLRLPLIGRLDDLIHNAGLTISTPAFLALLGGAAGLVYGVVFGILRYPVVPSLAAAAALGLLLPLTALTRMARRRAARFIMQLPEGIDMLVRSLRAGHPISAAVSLVAREMPDPLGSEFGIVFDEMTYGLDLRDALDNLAGRVPVTDLHFMVVAIRIQYNTGGNLAEILSVLSRVLRERERMRQKVRALSAEGRLSAVMLSVLPFLVGGGLMMINPGYYLEAKDHPMFLPILGIGFVGIVIGILAMQRIVNFRI